LYTSPKIGFSGSYSDKVVLKELLSPWGFQISSIDEADVIISRANTSPEFSGKIILIPNGSQEFSNFVVRHNHGLLRKEKWRQLEVPITESLSLRLTVETLYPYCTSESSLCGCLVNDFIYYLGIDVVAEYNRLLNETFNAKSSMRYQLFTSLPIPYTKAPKRFRDLVMTHKTLALNLNYRDKLPIDALRFILVKAIEALTKEKMKFAGLSLGKKTQTYLITHDVDSLKGFDRALNVKKIEEKYDIASAWFVPSRHYTLDSNVLSKLSNNGEVGSHDTEHDGKLVGLQGLKLLSRLKEGKEILEKKGNCKVNGFRAPLLQHNYKLLEKLKTSSFAYDSSVPTFEPNHPRTMGPHGLGTVYPINVCGLLEIPVTIIQDHQLLYALGLKPHEVIETWNETASLIKSLGGCCVTLSHPEYALFDKENLSLYESFLAQITSNNANRFITPNQLSQEIMHQTEGSLYENMNKKEN
jgi:hypothetical protein